MAPLYNPVFLKKGKESSLFRFHRWIFSGAIRENTDLPDDGEIVEIFDHKGNYLSTGHYQNSSISARILTFRRQEIGLEFWTQKIRKAYDLRKILGLVNSKTTSGYRLVFGEGDGLPGLVVDWYAGAAIIQTHSAGMERSRELVAGALQDIYGETLETIFYTSASRKGDQVEGFLKGSKEGTWFRENGLNFYSHWLGGQKTGYFLDQRENRLLLRDFVKDKDVLDAFSHAGGFAVNAMKGGARQVLVLDASRKAIQIAENNLQQNEFSGYQTHVGDALEFLNKTDRDFDVMVIDPPAFAKHISSRHKAIQGYKRLNIEALKRIRPGGIFLTFSCSQVIDRALFENTIRAAAIESNRKIRILHWLSQPADHPVDIFHPESSYLKGLVLSVQ
jgi:23S rRNA (cytosine1962-C5)-methyltransferase